MVSQFIAGSNLSELLDQQRPEVRNPKQLDPLQAVQMILPLVDALQHAHECGVVHRDVKPSNILVDHSGKPYLADFGLALNEDELGFGPRWLGTPAYMSPEQAGGDGHLVDGRTDIYSLGVVFYKMLCGRRPFQANSTTQMLDMILHLDAPSVRQKNRAIPAPLDRICSKALARKPADRYRSAGDWYDELKQWLSDQSGNAMISSAIPAVAIPDVLRHPFEINDDRPGIDGFELKSIVGCGSMGMIYRAWQPSAGREVAVKCLRLGDASAKLRFAAEIRALGRVMHPNLVRMYTSGIDDQRSWYAMEFIDGTSIGNLLRTLPACDTNSWTEDTWKELVSVATEQTRQQERSVASESSAEFSSEPGSFSGATSASGDYLDLVTTEAIASPVYVKRIAKIVQDISRAAQTLHDAQIVHRDIKPDNIVLTRDGQRAVLVDLGVAKLPRPEKAFATRSRQFVGSLRYASPEQVLDSASVDHRSDIYSLGVTLWELLTLQPIYGIGDQMNDSKAMLKIEVEEPGPVRRYNPSVPIDLQAITQRCLEKNPQSRYSSADELADDLENFLQSRPVKARPVGPLTRMIRRIQRRPTVPFLGMMVLLLTSCLFAASMPAPIQTSRTIRVGIKPWVGFCPLVVAAELDLVDGYDLELVPVRNTTDARQKLLARELDASPCLVDSHALGRASRFPSKVVLKLDVSMEADAVVSDTSIRSLADLRGKKVAYMHHEAPHFLLLSLCDKYGLDPSELIHVRVETAEQAAQEFVEGRVDAAVTYEPFVQFALSRSRSHRLVSAADDLGSIVDIMTVHEEFLKPGKDKIRALSAAWMESVRLLEMGDPKAIQIACRFLGDEGRPLHVDEYLEMASGMQYSGLAENLAFFRVDADGQSEFRKRFRAAQDRWDAHHQLHRKTDPKDGDGSSVLLEMYEM